MEGSQYQDKYNKMEGTVYKNPQRNGNRCDAVDIHEMMKREIKRGGGDSGGNYNMMQVGTSGGVAQQNQQQITNKEIGIKDTYIYFDSATAEAFNNSDGSMTFSIQNRNNQIPIENVIEMEVNEFYFPKVVTLPTQPDFYFYGRTTMVIDEIKTAQSIQGTNNFRFHFEFNVTPAGIAVLFTPIENKFIFMKPIRDLQQVTFIYKAPTKVIPIPQEILVGIVSLANIVTFSVPHGLDPAASHTIYFAQFITVNAPTQAILSDPNGMLLLPANITSTTTITLPGVVFDPTDAGKNITIYVGARKIAFTMRFRSIVDYKTNNIIPV